MYYLKECKKVSLNDDFCISFCFYKSSLINKRKSMNYQILMIGLFIAFQSFIFKSKLKTV